MKNHRYVLCDVFTDRPLKGTTVAVFTRATSLSETEMREIAREMCVSATAFVMRPEQGGHAKLKIFAPSGEVPLVGNAALAAAVVLGGPLQAQVVRLETPRGTIHVALERDGARIVFGWLEEPLLESQPYPTTERLLGALGIAGGTLSATLYQGERACALIEHHCFEDLSNLLPQREQMQNLSVDWVTVFAHESGCYRMRVFMPNQLAIEEAATASAAGLVALHLSQQGRLEIEAILTLEQGFLIGRPSSLCAKLAHAEGGEKLLLVGGAAVVVGRGELMV